MKSSKLTELADSLFTIIKGKTDCFDTTTIVVPNVLISQWLKSYWLKTEGENVLMNVEFKSFNDVFPYLVEQEQYKLIKHSDLKKIILSVLIKDEDNIIPEKYKKYYEGSSIRLNEFADSLATVYLNYYKDNFEGVKNWSDVPSEDSKDYDENCFVNEEDFYQYKLYKKIIDICKNKDLGTIEKPLPRTSSSKTFYLFGFGYLDKVYKYIVESCDFVKEYSLEVDETADVDYEITTAPSMIKEVEFVHGEICKLILKGAHVSDFYVVAPNIKEYVNTIERVFRQNDEQYPNIPYVIRYSGDIATEFYSALKLLYSIAKNKYYTRYDFYKLISNTVIKNKRGITDEEIYSWMKAIDALNVHRNHERLDDWEYLKKRLLLSKLSSINFDDNLVSLVDGDYLPYSTISFGDDSIVKIVNIIDDLNCFIELINRNDLINHETIENIQLEFSKWFSIKSNDMETCREFRNLCDAIQKITEMNYGLLAIDLFFFMLFEEGKVNSVQRGVSFTQGITFADFDVNSNVATKYVFFLGASSNNIPSRVVKSELDQRSNILNNNEEKSFMLLYQNTLKKFYISFMNVDLKTEEEFYLSPIVIKLNKRLGRYVSEDSKFNKIPLDETRPYSDLFTRKEFTDKAYYDNLLKSLNKSSKVVTFEQPIFYESLSVNQMSKFLAEPFKSKVAMLFNYDDDLQEKIKEEWEMFLPETLDKRVLLNKVLFEMINDTFDYQKTLYSFKLGNLIPTISDDYEKMIFDSIVKDGISNFKIIKELTDDSYQLLHPCYIKLLDKNNKEWMLSDSNFYCLSEKDNKRIYIELKDMQKATSVSKFLSLYIRSLMDVAQLNDGEYNVVLAKGKIEDLPSKKYQDRKHWEYAITPTRAKELLNLIHEKMGDFSENVVIPIDFVSKNIDSYAKFKKELFANFGPWDFFSYKGMFDADKDYGYDPINFKGEDFLKELNKQIQLIEFLSPKVLEDDEDGKQ